MKNVSKLFVLVVFASAFTGCVVAPAHPIEAAPAGVAYVAPTDAIPGPGYVWAYHPQYGWGWRHPRRGWHRGWR